VGQRVLLAGVLAMAAVVMANLFASPISPDVLCVCGGDDVGTTLTAAFTLEWLRCLPPSLSAVPLGYPLSFVVLMLVVFIVFVRVLA